MQTKEPKTAKELASEISNRLDGLQAVVFEDSMSGWTATVMGPSDDVAAKFQQISQVISELHANYDLKKEPETHVVDAEVGPSEATAPFTEPSTPPRAKLNDI